MKIGDTVRLKSGGPLMTIVGKDEIGTYTCAWFSVKFDECRSDFPEECLVPAEPNMFGQVTLASDRGGHVHHTT